MYKLLRTEIKYFKVPLVGIISVNLLFTFFSLSNIHLFSQIIFLKKYFWAIVVGLGSYGLVFLIWAQRVKEKHERIINIIPMRLKSILWERWIFAILPFVLVMLYMQILHFFLPDDWNIYIARISAQIGLLSMALGSIFLIRDIWYVKSHKSDIYKIFTAVLICIAVTIVAVVIVNIFSYDIIPPLYIHQEELIFFLWGLIISSASLILYTKRSVYLE